MDTLFTMMDKDGSGVCGAITARRRVCQRAKIARLRCTVAQVR